MEVSNSGWKEGAREELRQFVNRIVDFSGAFAQGAVTPHMAVRDIYEIAIPLSKWCSEILDDDKEKLIHVYVDRLVTIADYIVENAIEDDDDRI